MIMAFYGYAAGVVSTILALGLIELIRWWDQRMEEDESDDYLIRMKLERNSLRDRIERLSIFLRQMDPGAMEYPEEYYLMKNQLTHMRQYLSFLVQRIELHENDDDD